MASPKTGQPADGSAPRLEGLRLEGLAVGYRAGRAGRRTRTVLAGLDATAARGDLTVLLGPNGAGKSTLLRTLLGLQPPLGGRVTLDGVDLRSLGPARRARRIGAVLTERVDVAMMTARDVVALGRHPHTGPTGARTARDEAVVSWALAAVDAEHLAARALDELSDGERQRVMVARALAQEPSLLLLDEPSAFLDAPSRVALAALLRRLARERGLAVVVSTHDLELALRTADQVWLLGRDGALRAGSPEQLTLDGRIAAVFDGDELRFDPASATFTPRPPVVGTARISLPPPAAPAAGSGPASPAAPPPAAGGGAGGAPPP
ncbi:ABC transporter ATP-binding protein, partial [Frankia sp. CNm7]|uniref:ABC transporter ATP-binding protein n=1 Tax=Frankia nepalensis TaxID=1836974 RepID=UPI0019328D0F